MNAAVSLAKFRVLDGGSFRMLRLGALDLAICAVRTGSPDRTLWRSELWRKDRDCLFERVYTTPTAACRGLQRALARLRAS